MTDVLEQLRNAAAAAPKPRTPRAPTQQEKRDATTAPDAKKARDLVKSRPWSDLAELAEEIAKVTADSTDRIRLQERAEAMRQASAEYFRVQGQVEGRNIGWMGKDQSGHLAPLPEGAPDHITAAHGAWTNLLVAVNEATKVGIRKPNRYKPIELVADIDAGVGPKWD